MVGTFLAMEVADHEGRRLGEVLVASFAEAASCSFGVGVACTATEDARTSTNRDPSSSPAEVVAWVVTAGILLGHRSFVAGTHSVGDRGYFLHDCS